MNKNKIYALIAAVMTLAACSTDNDITSTASNAGGGKAVTIASATRTAEGGTVGMTLPFHLVNTTLYSSGNVDYQADFFYADGSYSTKGDDLVAWTDKGADGRNIDNVFQAYTPLYTPMNLASYDNFTLPYDQSTAELLQSADWMTATTTSNIDKANGSISLNFGHKFSKLHLDITTTKDDVSNLIPDNFVIKQGIINYVKPYFNTEENTIEAIIQPQPSSYPYIQITIDNGEVLTVPFPSENTSFEPGKQYNFNLAIGHDALTISSVSVTDWTPIDLNGKNEVWNKDDDDTEYITFSADSQQGFLFVYPLGYPVDLPGFEYSVNNGEWISIPDEGLNNAVSFGGDLGNLRLRGKNNFGTFSARTVKFTNDVKVACSGDIRTLIDYTQYKTVDTGNALFVELFKDCTQLTSAPMLPSTKLSHDCYRSMFEGCSSLTIAPVLPAGELSSYCYSKMFKNCTSLVSPPYISATTLAYCCCESMFEGCTALKKAPVLPAENLADVCYIYMFQNCTALKTAPSLPATTLAFGCYKYMFSGCTTLTNAPELHATTLADYCYNGMFSGCTALRKAPVLKAENLEDFCYSFMFEGCSNLSSVTMLATDVYGSSRLENWLNGAGTSATSRTLKLHNSSVYNKIKDNNEILPDKWQSGQATIIYEENP